ncbi:hypothetical protein [uncultured Roseovarius sp.]|uniref:hypothetical protein n=1 Tax=uncultured Roseovarius sp. TaxID=293344 RepID=UPI0025E6615F|nr:hypothetical protein [uncultured Roseovarius sp.]
MSSKDKTPQKPIRTVKHDPPKPVAEREPGQTAHTANNVKAKDPFGAPKPDAEWTPEAIKTVTRKPSLGGADDKVKQEQAKDSKT